MTSAICTLYEGHYHFGLAALANSLYKRGFRGVIWAGYRGALPPWATDVKSDEMYQEFQVDEGCVIRFVTLNTPMHFTNYKPCFMLDIWNRYCPDVQQLFYFDPDITIRCRWAFFEEWAGFGVALCEEIVNFNMPHNHPLRLQWLEYARRHGYKSSQVINQYFNGGFIGVSKSCMGVLCLWKELLEGLAAEGIDLKKFWAIRDRSFAFCITDQDVLNLAVMLTPHPLTTMGPEGMDFVPSGFTMSHATGSPKPWRKNFLLQALKGFGPSAADKQYIMNVDGPITVYSNSSLWIKRLTVKIGSLIGRFIKRS